MMSYAYTPLKGKVKELWRQQQVGSFASSFPAPMAPLKFKIGRWPEPQCPQTLFDNLMSHLPLRLHRIEALFKEGDLRC